MNMKRVISIITLLLVVCQMQAEFVVGRVVDAQSKEPLEGANISVAVELETENGGKMRIHMGATSDEKGEFTFRSYGIKNEMTVSYLGYYEKKMRVTCSDGQDTLRVGDIELEPTEFMLKTLQVTGHAKRFTMRGDTVVFNPDGFHLEAGDRLDKLIEKLPGVSNENGKLTWNGKPIRLRMNGNDAFSESMLGQLPVEAVQDIKAYDKKTELEKRTGNDDGKEDQVLDVTIKKSFLDKWYGALDMSAYSSPNYNAQLTGHYLSEHNPLMTAVRVSENGMGLSPYNFSGAMMGEAGAFYRQQMGVIGYQHSWKPKFEVDDDNNWDIMTYVNHQDERGHEHSTLETFLDGMAPTLQMGKTDNYEHSLGAPLKFHTYRNLSANTSFTFNAEAGYSKKRKSNASSQETNLLDVLGDAARVNRSQGLLLSHEEGKHVDADATLSHLFGKSRFYLNLGVTYKDTDADSHEQTNYDFYQMGTQHETDIQDFNTRNKDLTAYASADLSLNIHKDLSLIAGYTLNYQHQFIDDDRQRNGVADFANTMEETHDGVENLLNLGLNWNVKKFTIQPGISLDYIHERMDYQRARLDTLATRNSSMPSASFSIRFKPNRYHNLRFSADYKTRLPELIKTLAMVDDTNPLMVIEGNPLLKKSKNLSGRLTYSYIQPKHDQSLSLTFSYGKDFDPVQTVSYYNPQTGAYRMHEENTKGGESWGVRTEYSRAFGDNWQWDNNINASLRDSYGVLSIIEGKNERTLTQQSYTNLSYAPTLEYNRKMWKIAFRSSGSWSHYTYKGDEVDGYNLFTYSVGTDIQYKIGMFKIGVSPVFKGRKGYNNEKFNRDYLVLNGGVTYEPKKTLTLNLNVNDLLNKDERYYTTETSTTRSETQLTNFHHFVTLQCIYRFDAKGKNR